MPFPFRNYVDFSTPLIDAEWLLAVQRRVSSSPQQFVDSIAALRLLPSYEDATISTKGYYNPRDGGGSDYIYDPLDVTSADNNGTVIVGVAGARWKMLQGPLEHISIRQFGAKCDGLTADQNAIIACDTAARLFEKSVLIQGTPLITATITLTSKASWIFAGAPGLLIGGVSVLPGSYIIKDAAISGPAIIINNLGNGGGNKFRGGGIYCRAGNTGDGLAVWSTNFAWTDCPWIGGAGQDNIRIGRTGGISNANSFYFEKPIVMNAGRHGINIDDQAGSPPNANAGLIIGPTVQYSGQAGIRFNSATLGNVILAPTVEFNAVGILFDTLSSLNVIQGGDIEANVLNIQELCPPATNFLHSVTVEGVPYNTGKIAAAWVPTIFGSTVAGPPQTYTTQKMAFQVVGGTVHFWAKIVINTFVAGGTGRITMNLPNVTNTSLQGRVDNIPLDFILAAQIVTTGVTVAAGGKLVGLVTTASSPNPRLDFYVSNAGALTNTDIAAQVSNGATIYVSGSYPIFNY